MRRGACSNTFNNLSRGYARGYLEKRSFAERVLQKISDNFVDTKPRDIKSTCIICHGFSNFLSKCLRTKLTKKHSQNTLGLGVYTGKMPMCNNFGSGGAREARGVAMRRTRCGEMLPTLAVRLASFSGEGRGTEALP